MVAIVVRFKRTQLFHLERLKSLGETVQTIIANFGCRRQGSNPSPSACEVEAIKMSYQGNHCQHLVGWWNHIVLCRVLQLCCPMERVVPSVPQDHDAVSSTDHNAVSRSRSGRLGTVNYSPYDRVVKHYSTHSCFRS